MKELQKQIIRRLANELDKARKREDKAIELGENAERESGYTNGLIDALELVLRAKED